MNAFQLIHRASFILLGAFGTLVQAAAIYPIDQASILAGSKFDIKVEFNSVVNQNDIVIDL